MQLFKTISLILSLPVLSHAADVNEWLTLKERFLDQDQREAYHYESPANDTEIIEMVDLLNAMPPAEQWDALIATYQQSLEEVDSKSVRDFENMLLLAMLQYMAAPDGSDAFITSLKASQKQWKELAKSAGEDQRQSYVYQNIDRQLRQLINRLEGTDSRGSDIEEQIKRLEAQMARMQPVDETDLIAIAGSEENLATIRNLMLAQQAFQEQMMEKYEGVTEVTAEMREDYTAAQAAFLEEQKDAMELFKTIQQKPGWPTLMTNLMQSESNPYRREQLPTLYFPQELVSSAGQERSAALIRQALKLPALIVIHSYDQRETQELAAEIALEMIDELAVAQWALVSSPEDMELFAQMQERFPAPEKPKEDHHDPQYNAYMNAKYIQALSLIKAGQALEATELLATVESDPNYYIDESKEFTTPEQQQAAWQAFYGAISRNPDSPLWSDLFELSEVYEKEAEIYALVTSLIASQPVQVDQLDQAASSLAYHYSAQGDIESTLRIYRETSEILQDSANKNLIYESASDTDSIARHALSLGIITDNQELTDLSIQIAANTLAIVRAQPIGEDDYFNFYDLRSPLLQTYLELKNYTALEETALAEIDYLKQLSANATGEDYQIEQRREAIQQALPDVMAYYLLALYGQQRFGDMVDTLATSKDFNKPFLSDYLNEQNKDDLPAKVAYALHVAGQSETATALLEAQLLKRDDDDQLYEVLVEIQGVDAIPYLDYLSQINQFEERPLIWKGQALLDAGKLQQAEAVIKQAMTMDPSDGDQGKEDRMRVYAVMGAIREAQGNTEEAEFFDKVLRSIRISENADDYYYAGLRDEAIAMYEEALTYFVDAYCIQSRLAVKLMDAGQEEEAAKHYAKAFELMPDSFGRIESHCFGCEGAFRGETAQLIADRVFGDYIKRNPQDPQGYYLLAYLRMEQERYDEALDNLVIAVDLDPQYLNAWKKLISISRNVKLDQEQIDDIALNLLYLDPLGRNSHVNFSDFNNFRKLWPAMEQAAELRKNANQPREIYPLQTDNTEESDDSRISRYHGDQSVGQMALDNRNISAVKSLLSSTPRASETLE
ncbi:tetratricopeptide repeat protein [Cerasicoccus fimbriatus]|uniref:tetratricopeptide repeat protein n=1 Tax=Cerasicoccus fimbriatus TaxID=3014554 RepID=UPI0022B40311|nr:hypothetical protein [Cerasicoccus sp. TK19100]